MMDQQKRRRWSLIGGLILIGLAVLNLVIVFWAYFDGEKINFASFAMSIIFMTIAVIKLREYGQKGPTPPDPK